MKYILRFAYAIYYYWGGFLLLVFLNFFYLIWNLKFKKDGFMHLLHEDKMFQTPFKEYIKNGLPK